MNRTTPLRTHRPMRRSPMRRRFRSTKYSRRPRDFVFMGFVKRQPCIVRIFPPASFVLTLAGVLAAFKKATPCNGPVEADHMGARGIGQKADDRTCVPMCRGHHGERTDHTGTFRPLVQVELRAWRAAAIEHTQAAWRNQ